MAEEQDKIQQLNYKLDLLVERQQSVSKDILIIKEELRNLKEAKSTYQPKEAPHRTTNVNKPPRKQINNGFRAFTIAPNIKSDVEKFIGENLINKIGIVITIIGVAIGAKYAIDNELISPSTRILLGYAFGAALLLLAFRLKKNYRNFSAVLLSGAMAIMYFITYTAYSFYQLYPQLLAFGIMLIITIFTIWAAINYNNQVIAHIGLVGAYAVPFLLSEGSGKIGILFIYMAIINSGIAYIAFRKYWKPLYYSSFLITWLIYSSWHAIDFSTTNHFSLAVIFLSIFFCIFYITFLAYKLIHHDKFNSGDIVLLLSNSFLFYAFGYSILNDHETSKGLLGIFTLGNAVVHSAVGFLIYQQKLADRNLFYLVLGLALVFVTMAIPVQLDGQWVTLLWAGEAYTLFWIGRTRKVVAYEKLSYPLMLLAFFSIAHDWATAYDIFNVDDPESRILPLLNIHFLTSLLFIAAFAFMAWISHNHNSTIQVRKKSSIWWLASYLIPTILIFTVYNTFRIEIVTYWDQLRINLLTEDPNNTILNNLSHYKTLCIIGYSLLFLAILSFVNTKKIRNRELGLINLALNIFAILVFLVQGLLLFSEIRGSYSDPTGFSAYDASLRYLTFALVAILMIATYRYIRFMFSNNDFSIAFDYILHTTTIWILSSELIHWLEMTGSTSTYKIGLSILWGLYSLFLISIGIWKKKKHLRIGAIVLFGITLTKLFFYDINNLNTISKTIVFVSLGSLLLIISFLYNKYKVTISEEVK